MLCRHVIVLVSYSFSVHLTIFAKVDIRLFSMVIGCTEHVDMTRTYQATVYTKLMHVTPGVVAVSVGRGLAGTAGVAGRAGVTPGTAWGTVWQFMYDVLKVTASLSSAVSHLN